MVEFETLTEALLFNALLEDKNLGSEGIIRKTDLEKYLSHKNNKEKLQNKIKKLKDKGCTFFTSVDADLKKMYDRSRFFNMIAGGTLEASTQGIEYKKYNGIVLIVLQMYGGYNRTLFIPYRNKNGKARCVQFKLFSILSVDAK